MDPLLPIVLIITLFGLLGSGTWVAFSLIGVGFVGIQFFTGAPAGQLARVIGAYGAKEEAA